MKKIILTAMAVFAFGFANAQKVEFGAKAGINLAKLTDFEEANPSNRVGFLGGVFAEIKLTEKFSIQPEILYSEEGVKGRLNDLEIGVINSSIDANFTLKLSYVRIPVLAKFYASEAFYFEAGPQIGFLTSSKMKIKTNFNSIEATQDVNIFKSVDYNMAVGLGYNFTKKIFLTGRYNFGLTNIAKESQDDSKNKNSVFSFAVGYKF
jgi:hypothetical protein